MAIFSFEGKRPTIATSAYIAPSAQVIGQVTIGEGCYVGHGAIIRGDYGSIEIGDSTAIEEGVIIHARPEDWTRIKERVTVGHGAMIHNATIHEGAVIGMRAVISDYSVVGAGAIVGELALVKNGQQIPAGKVAVGLPAKVIGDVDERHRPMTHWAKELYVALAGRYNAGAMVELPPPSAAPDLLSPPDHDQAPPPSSDAAHASLAPMAPIGTIHTPFRQSSGTPIQGGLSRDAEGEIRLLPAYEPGLTDLKEFSHIIVLYAFHKSAGFKLMVTPFLDTQKRGLFATRAPRRPNPIGMTVVRLLEVDGYTLRVRGVDMLDGTPLLDIKPYVPLFDQRQETRVGWLEPHLKTLEHGPQPTADDRFLKDKKST